MKTQITASTARRANGWAPVIEFPNGGRQMFASRYGTMEEAEREARKGVRCRLAYPGCTVPDPAPNQLQHLAEPLPGDRD